MKEGNGSTKKTGKQNPLKAAKNDTKVITVAVIVGLCLIPSEASLVVFASACHGSRKRHLHGWLAPATHEATAIAEEQRLQDEQEVSQRAKPWGCWAWG